MPTQEIFNEQFYNKSGGSINGTLGGLAVAEKNQEYFIVFKQAGGTGPEIIGETAYFISYLVKSDGTVNKPAEDSVALNNLIQNFEVGKNAVVRQDAATALNSQLAGKHEITAIGRQQPILFSQTGSLSGSFTSSIFFKEGQQSYIDVTTADFRGIMFKTDSTPISPTYSTVTNYNLIFDPEPPAVAASFDQVPGTYSLESAGTAGLNSIFFRVLVVFSNTAPTFAPVTVQLRKYDDIVGDYTVLIEKDYVIPPSTPNYYTGVNDALIYNYQKDVDVNGFGGDPSFQVRIKGELNAGFVEAVTVKFKVETQNPSPGTVAVPTTQLPFWTTGSDALWLTASQYLSLNYTKTQDLNGFSLDDGFNFSPIITPFDLRIGDRIRFEYNASNDRHIYDIIDPDDANNFDGRLKLKINKPIPTTTNLNNFLIHRTDINDPAYIILNVDKDETVGDTQNFNGVILPEYPTPELKDNLDNIILDLKEKGIITDNEN